MELKMDINDVKQAKTSLTQEIKQAIFTFEKHTLCSVQEINLEHIHHRDDSRTVIVNVAITVTL